ncbi:hypothetical protein PYW08_000549 [Mythimna loreyi]|uniref:Uncharacterized protein n=1 Tax=Mythimna loreyi TaxID=667449 RepID=A0ACC2RCS1_9NEOP|nr:hypothetical protein PYW08_000549 [Mythimna loreyi]
MALIIIIALLTLGCVQGQFFEDRRCRCVCPNPASILNTTVTRQIYTGNVPPNQCDCEGVVYPLLKKELEGKIQVFCPRCECIYQTRNTTLIMAIVFLILIGLVMTVLYMASFTWLKFLVFRGRGRNIWNPFSRQADRHLERPPERDYIREHRGEFERERMRQRARELEIERQLEAQRERERERNRPGRDDDEHENLLDNADPEN